MPIQMFYSNSQIRLTNYLLILLSAYSTDACFLHCNNALHWQLKYPKYQLKIHSQLKGNNSLYGGTMQFSILLPKTQSGPHESFTIEDVFINLHTGDMTE